MDQGQAIRKLTLDEVKIIAEKREKGISTEEEDLAFYVFHGVDEEGAYISVGKERGRRHNDVVGGIRY